VYTHLATADEADLDFARRQLDTFLATRDRLARAGIAVGAFHVANSAAIFRLPDAHLDRVRPGLAMYGYWCGPAEQRPADLRPCMRVVSNLVAVRKLPAGHGVGYGRTFITPRASVIGLVPIGYADGYRRALSNRAAMTLEAVRGRGQVTVPVVGRVSMDQTTLDLTDAGDVRVGDPVIVIDDAPAAPNSVEALARSLDTIPYEVTCLIGERVARVGVRGGDAATSPR
jgi:alanine racemase